ncbi:hypothetical protein DM860_012629 [Cuscuta australis]|uniref:Pollen allergen ole e 6 n=1 Tax=Cuscuta australis TaxID=267555 RepID=A0A328DG10_9ASTE|nr:hypothetical protein DM860_012629 [Cuscuta australis]
MAQSDKKLAAVLLICMVVVCAISAVPAAEADSDYKQCTESCQNDCKKEGNGDTMCEVKCDTKCGAMEVKDKFNNLF